MRATRAIRRDAQFASAGQWRDKQGCAPFQQGIYTPYDDVAGFVAIVTTSDEVCMDRCDAVANCSYWTRYQRDGWCHLSGPGARTAYDDFDIIMTHHYDPSLSL